MEKRFVITGGAGFIGINMCKRLLEAGAKVYIVDDLSRRGTENNLQWLLEQYPSVEFVKCDIRQADQLANFFKKTPTEVVVHLAGQVAVTTSVTDPRSDFEINALGTFNVLEGVRLSGQNPAFLFASTNKVYGGMEHIELVEKEQRYEYQDFPDGIDEACPLDFHSPYGCSKGGADQYVRDYHRIYGMKTVVFRQSAIYGPRQFGIEDQGWAAWFTIAAMKNKPITIYGDGKQVRDLLWVDDLVDAYLLAEKHIHKVQGEVFNVGGGVENSISIWQEFEPILTKAIGQPVHVSMGEWRPGDQKVCIMDTNKIQKTLNWSPKVSIEQGMGMMAHWVKENLEIL